MKRTATLSALALFLLLGSLTAHGSEVTGTLRSDGSTATGQVMGETSGANNATPGSETALRSSGENTLSGTVIGGQGDGAAGASPLFSGMLIPLGIGAACGLVLAGGAFLLMRRGF